MLTLETANLKEVRRFRIAQFNGRTVTVRWGGSPVTGHVRSVLESGESIPPHWTITIVPSPPRAPIVPSRAAPRFQSYAEDFY